MASGLRPRTRTLAWIAASGVLHVAVVLGLRGPAPIPAPVSTAGELELVLDDEVPAPLDETQVGSPAAQGAVAALKTQPVRLAAATNAIAPTNDPGPADTEAAADTNGTGWSVSAFRNGPIAIYAAPNYAAMPAPSSAPQPEPLAPAQVSQTGGLREALASGDTARGLGRSGPAVSAAQQASNEAPGSGHLVLALTFDASGAATGIRIADRSDGDPSWDQYARAVLAFAKKKPARALPDGAKGMVVTMAVDSQLALPSGSTGGPVHVDGLGGTFDLADVGAKAKKRVTAHVLKEQLTY